MQIEIVAFNGEDYYAVPGQMKYIKENQNNFNSIVLNINIDGAGTKQEIPRSLFCGLPVELDRIVHDIIRQYPGISEGAQWPQGDHACLYRWEDQRSQFLQSGRRQYGKSDHHPYQNDNPGIVDVSNWLKSPGT
jgi:hypothetical protein